jgi:hypothetical protein
VYAYLNGVRGEPDVGHWLRDDDGIIYVMEEKETALVELRHNEANNYLTLQYDNGTCVAIHTHWLMDYKDRATMEDQLDLDWNDETN